DGFVRPDDEARRGNLKARGIAVAPPAFLGRDNSHPVDHVISPGVARLISRTRREEAAKIHQRTIHETGPVAPVDAGRHSVADNFALAEQLSEGFRMHFPREAVEGFVDGIRIVMQSGYRPVHRMVPTQRFHSPRYR